MSSSAADTLEKPPFDRIRPPKSLAVEVIDRIRSDIVSGRLASGARLPTEQEMIAAFGVSRTVVREAVAALRAEGLVATRQGVGAFVVEETQPRPFRIEPGGLALAEVLAIMELRVGVETEAAGLAAERATRGNIRALESALRKIDASVAHGELAVAEDFSFHRAVAEATGNPHFSRFLEFLGRYIIPRQSVGLSVADPFAYLAMIQKEHREILAAIKKRSVSGAQAAMRRHLTNSRKRYARIAARSGNAG